MIFFVCLAWLIGINPETFVGYVLTIIAEYLQSINIAFVEEITARSK
jgi:hypothetical protein